MFCAIGSDGKGDIKDERACACLCLCVPLVCLK